MKQVICASVLALALASAGAECAAVVEGRAVGLVGENGAKVASGAGYVTLVDHKALYYASGVPEGPDVDIRIRMAIDGLAKSAASLKLGDQMFGFEGADGTMFSSGGILAKAKLRGKAPPAAIRDGRIFERRVTRAGGRLRLAFDGTELLNVPDRRGAFGPVALAPFPFEMFSLFSLRLRKYGPFAYNLLCSCSNGGNGYLPDRSAIAAGGYEITWRERVRAYVTTPEAGDMAITQTLASLRKLASM